MDDSSSLMSLADFHKSSVNSDSYRDTDRLNQTLQKVITLEKKPIDQDHCIANLRKDLKTADHKYKLICDENRELNAIVRRHRRAEEKKEDPREKATVEERQAVKRKFKRKRQEEDDYNEFQKFKQRRHSTSANTY